MSSIGTKASWYLTGALLVCGGIGVGALASSLTTEARVWHAPQRLAMTEAPVTSPVDQAGAGQAWARTAFDGGLRQCPQINPEFLAACEAEIKALAARPAFVPGSYGGPLLITRVEPMRQAAEWQAQERLETPRAVRRDVDYEALPDEDVAEPAFDRTPDNYPAARVGEDPRDTAEYSPTGPS